jgi:hypothetical protein
MEFELKFNDKEINIILKGLGELQAKESVDLIIKIKTNCEAKIKEAKKENNG